jgi:hypothetical protein
MEIHYGAGRAAGAEQVTVTLYRGVLGSSDLQKVETFRTGIDGLYHFENIPKGEYTIHVQGPNVKEPDWGPAAYRRVTVADDDAVIELDPTIIDYKWCTHSLPHADPEVLQLCRSVLISWADMVLAPSVAGLFKLQRFEPEMICRWSGYGFVSDAGEDLPVAITVSKEPIILLVGAMPILYDQ